MDGLVELSARFVRLVDAKRFVLTMPHSGEPLMAPLADVKILGVITQAIRLFPDLQKTFTRASLLI